MQGVRFSMLTSSEIENLEKRLEIIRQLKAGKPQHQIAKNLGVGVATVVNGAAELKKGRFENV